MPSSNLPELIMILVISLSIISMVAVPSDITPLTGVLRIKLIVSLSSSKASSIIGTITCFEVSPAPKTTVPETGV